MKEPWYQRVITYAPWWILGITFVSSLIDILNNLGLITPSLTYLGTAIVLLVFLSINILLRRRPIPWVTRDHQKIHVKSLGLASWFILIGILVALWTPRFIKIEQARPTNSAALLLSPTSTASLIVPAPTSIISNKLPVQVIDTSLGQNSDFVRTQVVLLNNLEQGVFANHVMLYWDNTFGFCWCEEPPCSYEYEISADLFIQIDSRDPNNTIEFTAPVYPKDQSFDGFSYLATGTIIDDFCGGGHYTRLEFDVSVVLEPKKFTALYIDIPVTVYQEITFPDSFGFAPPKVEVFTNIGKVTE